jgi:taurine dioxygenase
MTDEVMSLRKLAPSIGADVEGIDLTRPLSDLQIELIREALLEHLVIFFRDQNLTPAEHKAFARHFGNLHIHPAPLGILDGDPEIIIVEANEKSRRIAGEVWHSDVSCDTEAPMASILHLKEVPAVGGDTLFANMYAAYEALPASMQRFLSGLTAIHDGRRNYDGRATAGSRSTE